MVGFFLDINCVNFFGRIGQYLLRSIQKRLFEILVIFLDHTNILNNFSDRSLNLGNQLVPIKRYPYFLPIPMFLDLKKIPTGPNK